MGGTRWIALAIAAWGGLIGAQAQAPPDEAIRARVAALIAALDAPSFRDREAATTALAELGDAATEALVAARAKASLEAAGRIQVLLDARGWLADDQRPAVLALIARVQSAPAAAWSYEANYWIPQLGDRRDALLQLLQAGPAARVHLTRALRSDATARLAFAVTAEPRVVRPGQTYALRAALSNHGPGGVWLARSMERARLVETDALRRRWVTIGEPELGGTTIGSGVARSGVPDLGWDPLHTVGYLAPEGTIRLWQIDGTEPADTRYYRRYRWGVTLVAEAARVAITAPDGAETGLAVEPWTGTVEGSTWVECLPPRELGDRGTANDGAYLALTAAPRALPGAPLVLEARIGNASEKPLAMLDPRSPLGGQLLWYAITRADTGTLVRWGTVHPDLATASAPVPLERLDSLPPGEAWTAPVQLERLPAGRYEVMLGYGQAAAGNPSIPGKAWTGELLSNTLAIEIGGE